MNSIKEHYLYPLYLKYLDKRRLSKGGVELSKLSEEAFFEFKHKYDTSEKFKEDQDAFYKSTIREEKITTIIEDDEFF